ncbi:hypothetical protein B0H10DRAFT_1903348 [Mycena sp. CBHHK59/15]|nr:hypothetical protein B0H10DRAFT_1903348 [Mycena sp. CBHHK59/15]
MDIAKLTVPLFIGTVLNWALLGALLVQVYIYFLAFPKDRKFSKLLVVFILVAEILQTATDTRNTIRTFGADWGNFQALDEVGWAWFSVPIIGSTIACVGQLFFGWRIYIISRKLYIPILIGILAAGIWSGVQIGSAKKFSRLQFDNIKTTIVRLA